MELIKQTLAGLDLGAAQVHLNLAFVPLNDTGEALPGYMLLDEALGRNFARVTEVSNEGRVPELAFENASAEKILLVDGDELVGARQNRILNLSILVGVGRKLVIPVSCVEQGRWSYRRRDFGTANRSLFARARAKNMSRVSESMRSHGERRSNQSEIWEDVADKARFYATDSATQSMSDVYEQSAKRLAAYRGAFHAEPRQRGAVVAIDGRVAGVELFDSARTFSSYLPKLVNSYALDAIETAGDDERVPSLKAIRAFLKSIAAAPADSFEALGEGSDIRFSAEGISGGALAADGRIVHLAGFAGA